MLDTRPLLTDRSQNYAESLVYPAFNKYIVQWINAAGSIISTSETYGKIFMCHSRHDISQKCTDVSRNASYIGLGAAFPVLLINSMPLILNDSMYKKFFKKINARINHGLNILGNQTFYVLCLSAALTDILNTDNINNAVFIGIIGIPSFIVGVIADRESRYQLYHWINKCRNTSQNLITDRNYCQKILDGLMCGFDGASIMITAINTVEKIIDYGRPIGYPWAESRNGKIVRYVLGGIWGGMMGIKSFIDSPNNPNNIDLKTRDYRDKLQALFATFSFFTLIAFSIQVESKKDELIQFSLLGLLVLLSLLLFSTKITKKYVSEGRAPCWGNSMNFFKRCLTREESEGPLKHDSINTNNVLSINKSSSEQSF